MEEGVPSNYLKVVITSTKWALRALNVLTTLKVIALAL